MVAQEISVPVESIGRLDQAPAAIRLNQNDDVLIATREIKPGTAFDDEHIAASEAIPAGHKIAARAIATGQPVRRYNQIIGFATRDIAAGQHVHLHNLSMHDFERDYAFCADVRPDSKPATALTFNGIVRADGRVATRNYIGVVSSVNCSAGVCRQIADAFRGNALDAFPNVDGIVPITHKTGCGMASNGEGIDVLRRVIAGYIRHPNFAAVLFIGLGCESNQISSLLGAEHLAESATLHTMTIQDTGGTRKTIERGIELLREMLPAANQVSRQPVPISHITVGLQCGGSDGYSGITANPALGAAMDLLVAHGGTAILSETPEIYGAEHLLTRRAVSREVGEKLVDRIHWWERYTERMGGEMNNNPSPGNKAGGLTTILEKSLGAVAKAGTSNLSDVVEYAQPVRSHGLVFMDTPGYDPVSATGQVAGGANVICFTTGRGSVYGCKPTPSLKLATNTSMYRRMSEDMDINCGEILEGGATVQQVGEQIFRRVIEIASGDRSKSELHGFGEDEFAPWVLGATM
ncbi:altronate dehydratase family protein [Paralcaligenes sp. KSB-10]|uniref:UxaA family hydrolase n=1 Tax=Paralcaligenes sp. KSB-10 TaxID=2901142 RepID=UPI001E3F8BBF|nr:altronate dehydratase family protein [Paralcaligenes sp. KSB-10]UHL63531.1 altronate dehydratase family protein [Paralcaligenes sp. KSB-10]